MSASVPGASLAKLRMVSPIAGLSAECRKRSSAAIAGPTTSPSCYRQYVGAGVQILGAEFRDAPPC